MDEDGREKDGKKINTFQSFPESKINYINGQQPKISPLESLLLERANYPQYTFSSVVEAEFFIFMTQKIVGSYAPYTSPYLSKVCLPFIRR
jgi:hypothetical protein